jgi:hypothetical protein
LGELVFENKAKVPLLLLRQAPEYHGFQMRSINPALSEHPLYESYPTIVHPMAPESRSYKQSDFIQLRPTEQHTEPASFSVFYRKPGGNPAMRLPSDGSYSLRFRISIWHDSSEEAARAARALGAVAIWTSYLWSEPIRVDVRSATPTEACR